MNGGESIVMADSERFASTWHPASDRRPRRWHQIHRSHQQRRPHRVPQTLVATR